MNCLRKLQSQMNQVTSRPLQSPQLADVRSSSRLFSNSRKVVKRMFHLNQSLVAKLLKPSQHVSGNLALSNRIIKSPKDNPNLQLRNALFVVNFLELTNLLNVFPLLNLIPNRRPISTRKTMSNTKMRILSSVGHLSLSNTPRKSPLSRHRPISNRKKPTQVQNQKDVSPITLSQQQSIPRSANDLVKIVVQDQFAVPTIPPIVDSFLITLEIVTIKENRISPEM
jgi:hypothetical protein